MAKATLPVNFKDDILGSSMGGKRRWILTQNSDGTYTMEDATTYTQVGSTFGAAQINATNQAVNESLDKSYVIDDLDDIAANTTSGKAAGALALKTLNKNLGGLQFAQDAEGNWGYKPSGADTVIPFSNSTLLECGEVIFNDNGDQRYYITFSKTYDFRPIMLIDHTAYRLDDPNNYLPSILEGGFTLDGTNTVGTTVNGYQFRSSRKAQNLAGSNGVVKWYLFDGKTLH